MVLDPIPQSLAVHFFGSRPQPPTSQCAAESHRPRLVVFVIQDLHDCVVLLFSCFAKRSVCYSACCSVCCIGCCNALQSLTALVLYIFFHLSFPRLRSLVTFVISPYFEALRCSVSPPLSGSFVVFVFHGCVVLLFSVIC